MFKPELWVRFEGHCVAFHVRSTAVAAEPRVPNVQSGYPSQLKVNYPFKVNGAAAIAGEFS